MDQQKLVSALDAHTREGRLDLPPSALGSDPVGRQLALYLPGENLVIDPVGGRQSDAGSVTVTGRGANDIFSGMTVTARFDAAGQGGLSLTAEAAPGWTLADAFPRLRHTLAAALRFKEARWLLSAGGPAPEGLTFRGTLDTENSLGFFLFLVGDTEEVLAGEVASVAEGAPEMRLAGGVRGATSLGFISLGPVSLALLTSVLPPVRPGGPKQAAVEMQVSTSVDFTSGGVKRQIPLAASIYTGSSALRLDADTTQLAAAGLDELKALVNGVDLGGLSFGDFELEDVVRLAQLTFIVDPASSSKLTSAALTLESATSWDLLERGGKPFLTLEKIKVVLGITAPFAAADLSARLRGELLLAGGRIVVEALLAPQNVRLQGYLDPSTPLSLRELAARFLGETDPHTPDLLIGSLNIVVEPGRSYQLAAGVTDLWEVDLGGAKFEVTSLSADWQYTAGGKTTARLAGEVQFGGVDIAALATYDPTNGWDFSAALGPGQTIPVGDLLADLLYYFGVELPPFVEGIRLDTLSVDFNTTRKSFAFAIGGGLPVEEKWLGIHLSVSLEKKAGGFDLTLSGTLSFGGLEFDLVFEKGSTRDLFVAVYDSRKPRDGAPASLDLHDFVAANLSASAAEFIPQGLQVDVKDVMFAFTTAPRPAAGGQAAPGGQAASAAPGGDPAATRAKFVFALDVGVAVTLSDLPLVGQKLPRDLAVGVDNLRLLVASDALTQPDVDAFNTLITPKGVAPLASPAAAPPAPAGTAAPSAGGAAPTDTAQTGTATTAVITKGLTLSAMMNFGGSPQPLGLPVGGGAVPPATTGAVTPAAGAGVPATATDNAKWFSLQKAFGPVYFDKVGVKYQDAAVWFLLNASLSVAGLTLSLDGLAVGSSVKGFRPRFDLRGLGVQYKGGGEVEIGGALLRIPKEVSKKDYDEYDGAAFVKAGQLKLSALGSYAEVGGHPSLFVYAVLDYPIGGPSFFFVTGLAAGFGYNRSLVVPPIEQVAKFPLVADALSGAVMPQNVSDKVASLQRYVPPSVGDYFLAVGIKFTSFKLIDSFALLTVSFGTQFEVNLLGLSTLVVPTPIPGETFTPLAEVQLAVLATFNPARGFLGVSAQLTSNSFILSRDCRLTGGFAFYSWFDGDHKGDFVLTLGGYHPEYKVPAHYPSVPRLGFNWRVDNKLSIKGGSYYALTAAALMAGGSLQATWDSGDIKAHFTAAADFIIYWRPYRYDAKLYVDIGVSYTYNLLGTHHLNVDVGADLHIWGPEFAGTAHVKLSIISFDISFGAGSAKKLKPVNWSAFRDSFLPKRRDGGLEICGVSVTEGLLSTPPGVKSAEAGADGDGAKKDGKKDAKSDAAAVKDGAVRVDWFVDPKTFVLVTNSVIPSKDAYHRDQAVDLAGKANAVVGIAPMALAPADFFSRHTVSLSRWDGIKQEFEPADDHFDLKPVTKNVPVALWGQSLTPSLNGPAFVADTLAGFEVRPRAQPAPGVTADIERSALQYDTENVTGAFAWRTFRPFTPQSFRGADEEAEEAARRQEILKSIRADEVGKARVRLLSALGFDDAVDLATYGADGFNIPPQVEA